MPTALLLIAHGSRQAQANADLEHVAEGLRQRGYTIVQPAYLELAEPDIDEGGRRCVEQGAGRVVLVPYFLSAGTHVQRDLVAARQRLATRFADVDFHLAQPLGQHELLLDVLQDRIRAVDA